MISLRRIYFGTVCAALIGAQSVSAASPPHPQCPWVNPSNDWRDFISGRVPPKVSSKGITKFYFAVRFENMGGIPDSKKFTGASDPLGTLWKGSCYTVYFDAGAWHVAGYNEQSGEPGIWSYSNANPDDYKISLWGRVFDYNEAGELIDARFGYVGNFRCVLDHRACERFAD